MALLDVQSRRQWLGDPRVQRRGPAGNDETVVAIAGRGSVAVARARAQAKGGSHSDTIS
jgi:hypothetical protein